MTSKILIALTVVGLASYAGANSGSKAPENPGQEGQTKAFFTDGFQKVVGDQGLTAATRLFGNKGKGNGSDPDPLGLASDHDPGVVGGEPDTTR